jgi:hypothetical protein
MTMAEVLQAMRIQLGDALTPFGEAAPSYSDKVLAEFVRDAAQFCRATGIFSQDYTVEIPSAGPPTISPLPEMIDGLILGALSVENLLSGDLVTRARQGELGVRFETGMEVISTVEAGKHVAGAVNYARRRFRYLVTQKLSSTLSATKRVQ